MFAESLLETSWAQRGRRSWSTLSSFVLQCVVIACLLMLPLWRTVGLPSVRALPTPISLGAPAPIHHVQVERATNDTIRASNLAGRVLIAPHEVPNRIAHIEEEVAPPQIGLNLAGDAGTAGSGSADGVLQSLNDGLSRPVVPVLARPKATAPAFRTSDMLEGSLIRRVQPSYPALARAARIQGQVILAAVISRAGTIKDLRTVTGHPLLVPAAVEAVSQWRYRPYVLNGEAIEVETQITVNFILGGN